MMWFTVILWQFWRVFSQTWIEWFLLFQRMGWAAPKTIKIYLETRKLCEPTLPPKALKQKRRKAWASALDKLLGQLGIYATWLSSIAYLQKQLRIFIYFLRHVFGSDYTRFLIEWSHRECAYILTLIVCLSEYQTSGFLSYLNQISSPCWH